MERQAPLASDTSPLLPNDLIRGRPVWYSANETLSSDGLVRFVASHKVSLRLCWTAKQHSNSHSNYSLAHHIASWSASNTTSTNRTTRHMVRLQDLSSLIFCMPHAGAIYTPAPRLMPFFQKKRLVENSVQAFAPPPDVVRQ